MKTLEDYIETLAGGCFAKFNNIGDFVFTSPADRSFLIGVSEHTRQNKQLSTNQSYVAIKIIKKNLTIASELTGSSEAQLISFCNSPLYRNDPYKSTIRPREIRHIGKRKIAFSSKKSNQVIDRIKSIKDPFMLVGANSPYFVYKHLMWVVEVTESNIDRVFAAIKKLNFSGDQAVVDFFEKCEEAEGKKSCAVVTEDAIQLEINNDEFMAAWFDQILEVELNVRAYESPEEPSDS